MTKLKHNYKIPGIYDDLNDLNLNAIKSPKPLAKNQTVNSQMKMCLRKITFLQIIYHAKH